MPKNRHPIPVYLPYLAGTADERQYRVMTDRESWFRIVMGQEEVARIIPNEEEGLSGEHREPHCFDSVEGLRGRRRTRGERHPPF